MTAKTSWTVKGVDLAARDLAKRQARKSGVTIGSWLNDIILNSEQPLDAAPKPRDGEPRLDVEALSSRLELLEARLAETTGAVERSLQNVEMSVVSGFAELDRRMATAAAGVAAARAAPEPAPRRRVIEAEAEPPRWRRAVGLGAAACLFLLLGGGVALVQAKWPERTAELLASLGAGGGAQQAALPAKAVGGERMAAQLASLEPAAGGAKAEATSGAAKAGELSYQQALRLLQGDEGAPDQAQAEQLLEAAGRQGHLAAQLELVDLYLADGRPGGDVERGLYWLMKAAGAGEPVAEYRLALLYAAGDKVARNYRQAATWFHRAADHGHVDAQYNLGLLYTRGIGVKRDVQIAHEWFSLAADKGDSEAQRKRDELALLLVASNGLSNARSGGLSGGLSSGLSGRTGPVARATASEWPLPTERLPRMAADAEDSDGVLRELAPLLGQGPQGLDRSGYDSAWLPAAQRRQ